MKKEKLMKAVNRKFRLKDFHIIDIDETDFKEKIEVVHMENCFLIEPTCKFGDKNCPANPFSSCNH